MNKSFFSAHTRFCEKWIEWVHYLSRTYHGCLLKCSNHLRNQYRVKKSISITWHSTCARQNQNKYGIKKNQISLMLDKFDDNSTYVTPCEIDRALFCLFSLSLSFHSISFYFIQQKLILFNFCNIMNVCSILSNVKSL